MPTALELGQEGWKPYIEAARRRSATKLESPSYKAQREQLLVRVRKVAAALKERFGARRVVLFGSLAHEAWCMPDSDVDLAVEGLTAEGFWQAWRLAEELISDRPVDLIDIETVGESMRRAINRHGIEL
jgi:predicted nucleotidyltransferase